MVANGLWKALMRYAICIGTRSRFRFTDRYVEALLLKSFVDFRKWIPRRFNVRNFLSKRKINKQVFFLMERDRLGWNQRECWLVLVNVIIKTEQCHIWPTYNYSILLSTLRRLASHFLICEQILSIDLPNVLHLLNQKNTERGDITHLLNISRLTSLSFLRTSATKMSPSFNAHLSIV